MNHWLAGQIDYVCCVYGLSSVLMGSVLGGLIVFYVARRRNQIGTDALRLFSHAVEQSMASIVITDTQGRIEYVNPTFTQVTGYTPEEVRGKNPRVLKSGKSSPEEYKELWQAITAGRNWRGEFQNRRKNGELYWEWALISPIADSGGKITHFLAVKENITERKETEEALQKSLAILRATLESTADGILVIDQYRRPVCWSQKFVELWNIPEAVLRMREEKPLLDFVLAEIADPASFLEARARAFSNLTGSSMDEIRLKDGRLLQRYSQPQFIDGQLTGRVWSFRDVTKVQRLLDEQNINIDAAKQLLQVVNGGNPRRVELDERTTLFVEAVSMCCKAAGGDHWFVRTLPATGMRGARTVVSVKDQSGHEVNCILRSIATDLIHHALLADPTHPGLEQQLEKLNGHLRGSALFAADDFLTAITVEIDHGTRMMRYAACGHPPLAVIRQGQVLLLPEGPVAGRNFPLGALDRVAFNAGEWSLQEGDRVLLYTDGLTEMPVSRLGRRLDSGDFRELLRQVIADDPAMPVSEIVSRTLARISALSGEHAEAGDSGGAADDVTIVGLEIEGGLTIQEAVLRPGDSAALCTDIERLYLTIADQWSREGLGQAEMRLRILLEEAILNAWKHGNSQKPGSAVRVRWHTNNEFVLEVVDEGRGFDMQALPDPRSDKRRVATDGRGIFMIKKMCDFVQWKRGGSHMVASFARHSRRCSATQEGLICRAPNWRMSGGKGNHPWN